VQAGINVWTSHGPPGGYVPVTALAVDPKAPTTLYAGTGGGQIFKSNDAGGSWSLANSGLTNTIVNAFAIDPATSSTLYAAAGYAATGGVFKSTDGGGSWSLANSGLPGDWGGYWPYVWALAIDPATPSTLYAGTASSGVFKSNDAGGNWSAANTGLPGGVLALAIDAATPSTLYAGTYRCFKESCAPPLFKSTDGGGTWALANTGLTIDRVNALAIDPTAPSTLYAGTVGSGVFKSSDGGGNWSPANTGLPAYITVTALTIDSATPSTLYAGTGFGVFKSTDGGGTWGALNAGLTNTDIRALAIDPKTPTRLYAGTYGGGVFAIEQAQVVGSGTPASCTEAALDAALAPGGLVTFDCGTDPLTITITSTKTIAKDTTIDGGGRITISGGNAVGVFAVNSGATFDVRNLTIADGHSNAGPGGVGVASGGTLRVSKTTFSNNKAVGGFTGSWGGAIVTVAGTVTVTESLFSGNNADTGGAIAILVGGTLTVSNSTFAGNTNGAIANQDSTVTITNSTFTSSGLWNIGVTDTSTVTVANSIIASYCSGEIIDGGHNLQFPGSDCGATIPSLDPLLGPLANNGGPTQTIALLPGSPAIDAGDPEVCANPPVNGVDQRGYVRPGIGAVNCSIGAFEYNSPGPPVSCVGDCDDKGTVTVDELVMGVNIALGTATLDDCDAFDSSHDGTVTVDELVIAVNAALNGCGG
jgi:hypothetical protein